MNYVTQCFPALAIAGVRGDAKQARPCKKPYTGTLGNCKRVKNSNKSQAKVKKEADRLGGKRTQREDAKSKARRKKIARLRENLAAKRLKKKSKPENVTDSSTDDELTNAELNDLISSLDNKVTRKPKSIGGPGKGKSKAQQKRDSDAFLRKQGFSQDIIDTLNQTDADEKRALRGLPPKKKRSTKAKGFSASTKKKGRKKRR